MSRLTHGNRVKGTDGRADRNDRRAAYNKQNVQYHKISDRS